MHSHRISMAVKRKHHNHSRLLYNQEYNTAPLLYSQYKFNHAYSHKIEHYDWEDDYWVVKRSTGWKTHKNRHQYDMKVKRRNE